MRLAKYLSHAILKFLKECVGASLMEYTLVISLIVVVCLLAMLALAKLA